MIWIIIKHVLTVKISSQLGATIKKANKWMKNYGKKNKLIDSTYVIISLNCHFVMKIAKQVLEPNPTDLNQFK